jgi:hypothetical protein
MSDVETEAVASGMVMARGHLAYSELRVVVVLIIEKYFQILNN